VPTPHGLARRRTGRLAALRSEPRLGADAGDDAYILGPARLGLGDSEEVSFAVREWTAKLGLVAAGLGVTLVPSLAAGAARSDVSLVRLHRADAPVRAVYAATLRGISVSPPVTAFLDLVRVAAKHRGGVRRSTQHRD
jgi:DNA-binding transcriptional LysR family regulator